MKNIEITRFLADGTIENKELSVASEGLLPNGIPGSPEMIEEYEKGYEYIRSGELMNPNEEVHIPLPKEIMTVMADFLSRKGESEKTGCLHSAALCKKDKVCYGADDISRHNAIYKAVGACLKDEKCPGEYYLCTTGRLPLSMVELAQKAGISVIVSRSGPTDKALVFAKENNLKVFCFASDKSVSSFDD